MIAFPLPVLLHFARPGTVTTPARGFIPRTSPIFGQSIPLLSIRLKTAGGYPSTYLRGSRYVQSGGYLCSFAPLSPLREMRSVHKPTCVSGVPPCLQFDWRSLLLDTVFTSADREGSVIYVKDIRTVGSCLLALHPIG